MTAALAWTPPRSAISQGFDAMLDGLVTRHGIADLVDDHAAADFLDAPGRACLLFLDDPDRVPESWDLAVILPELLQLSGEPLRAALVRPGRLRRVEQHFGLRRMPALVLLRDGGYLGTLDGLRDWSDYVAELPRLFAGAVVTPPSAAAAARQASTDTPEAP